MSGDPFHGSEYAVVGLTRTNRPPAIGLAPSAWVVGDPGEGSYASPWYAFTVEHADIDRPKGALSTTVTDRVANAVSTVPGAT
jgi:hypothetical protein